MSKYKRLIEVVVALMVFFLMGIPIQAQNGSVTYKGVKFPLGNKSFADKVVSFKPGGESGEKDGTAAIGFPDVGKGTGPSIIGHKGDVTLGKGGNMILKFTDNYLIDVKGLDLYIFEAGPSVEAFKVEISKHGSKWIDLGVISGQPTGLDINAKVTPGDKFSYVRITDPSPYVPRDPKTIGQSLYWGADIDAVGAIGSEEKYDSDGDGVSDDDDQCAGTLVGTEVDKNGCPVINNNQNTFSCTNKDNEEKGCCCFKGAHTYLFASHYVGNVLAQFDTGRKINCKSMVTFDVRQGDQWSSIKQFQANSSKNGSEVNLVDVVVPVNKKINGFRISDGCVCCLDTSKIYLNTNKLQNKIGDEEKHDSDGDGVSDDQDKCSGTSAGTEVDEHGCQTGISSTQRVCASADPSITDGSAFKSAMFTIGGTVSQEVRIIRSADNFAIAREKGGVVFRMVKGKSWGSLTLKPGTYILSCNGGGAMELMSARVCIKYPGVGGMANIDSDGDGVSDADDQCADTPVGTVVDLYGCPVVSAEPTPTPISTLDSDGDGVSDVDDQCAGTSLGIKVDEYGCPMVSAEPTPTAISTLDSDGDGISDSDDQCAGTLSGIKVDKYGCPVVSSPSVSCDWTGTWDTSWGKMELAQTGDSERGAEVTGTTSLTFATRGSSTRSSKPEKGNIQSIVMGDKLSGAWLKRPSYGPPKDAGDILFIISKDCNSFKGKWRYGYGGGNWDGDWTGRRTGSSKPPSKEPSKQTVCASANPSFTQGGQFKPATFVIGGTEPQKISIIESADNFTIRKKDVWNGGVYQSFRGKHSGSLMLDPGTYILSCSGGGAIGIASDRVCIGYPVVGGTPPSGGQIVPPESGKTDDPPKSGKDDKLLGPIESVIIRPENNLLATKLTMKIGDKKQKFIAWGEDAAGNKKSVTVEDWVVRGKIDERISDDGVFKTGSNENVVTILATVKNEEGDYITGDFLVIVTKEPSIILTGKVKLYDEHTRLLKNLSDVVVRGYVEYWKNRKVYKTNPYKPGNSKKYHVETRTTFDGKFKLTVPAKWGGFVYPGLWHFEAHAPSIKLHPGYVWCGLKTPLSTCSSGSWPTTGVYRTNEETEMVPLPRDGSILKIGIGKKMIEPFILWIKEAHTIISGKVTHPGKPMKYMKVSLVDNSGAIKEYGYTDQYGHYQIQVENLASGNYRFNVDPPQTGNIVTIHNLLYMKKDVFVDLPLKNKTKTIDIEMVRFKDKVGHTGP